jgi:protein-L-isoaspartate(D-aspartate) O-methyltransferase
MEARQRMVAEHLARRGISDPAVLEAFREVPREAFVAPDDAAHAYDDAPLEIGHGQTISQPYVVALMAELLHLTAGERLLEIGTGSGYAAAIFARLVREVHTVERIPAFARAAADRIARLGVERVHVHEGDGSLGWPPAAPYDAIAVAAAAPRPPQPLLDQLARGGRLLLPVGDARHQRLVRVTRRGQDAFEHDDLGPVRFVPLLGAEGWVLPA